MKAVDPGESNRLRYVLIIVITTGTAVAAGLGFYHLLPEPFSWIAAGSGVALLAALCAATAFRTVASGIALRTTTRPGTGETGEKDGEAAERFYLRNQLITSGMSRKLAHETINLLHNIDLVIHGLKNETLSARGSRILSILNDETARMKQYIRNYQHQLYPLEIIGRIEDIRSVVAEAFSEWCRKSGQPGIGARFNWPPHPAMVRMDAPLMKEAFRILFDYAAGSPSNGDGLEIHGKLEKNRIVIAVPHRDNWKVERENPDMFEPFTTRSNTDAPSLSALFIAGIIVEAHQGRVCLTGTADAGTAFEVSLPPSGPAE